MNIWIAPVAFVSEYLDSGLGMGYGTALAPILILMGFAPLQVVPAILISQLITDVAACISHQSCANVDFKLNSPDLKIALMLGLISSVGVLVSVLLAIRIPKWLLTLYIGLLVTAMGGLILFTAKRPIAMSWGRIMGISFLASFNKGISGGGYGPLIMGGQILSGINAKNAIGITAFAEAITCVVGFAGYLLMGKTIDWKLTLILLASAVPAVPVAALTVRAVPSGRLKRYVGLLITVLGLFTILRFASS